MPRATRRRNKLPESSGWLSSVVGYKLGAVLSATGRSRVFSATREADELPVLIKVYRDDAAANGVSRTLRERETLDRVAGPGIPRVFEVIESDAGRALVMEALPGRILRDWRKDTQPSVEQCLDIGAKIASLLARVHGAHLIHGDVHPANLLFDPALEAVSLLDFGVARPVGSASSSKDMHSAIAAGDRMLHFIAPEQAGRMGRGVDARSDLYSLGATLYSLLTGSELFNATDPMALIHAHMAITPEPPQRRRSEIPDPVGQLVMRLLEKEPEDRYQSAEALLVDLDHCLAALRRGPLPAGFSLPSADLSMRPVLGTRLIGRESSQELLRAAFESCKRAGLQWVVIRGASGMGKSALVSALGRSLTGQLGYFISGKFDSYRQSVPYAGFASALESLAFQMLSEPDVRLARSSQVLRESLGQLAGVLTSFVPDFGAVLGEVAPLVPLGPRETRSRLALVLARTLAACASRDQPLVLFLDDVQWSDAASRFLVSELLEKLRDAPVLMLLALRDESGSADSVREAAKTDAWLKRCAESLPPVASIELDALPLESVRGMLAGALGSASEAIDPLAELVFRKTSGSPLLIKEFVDHLHARGALYRERDGWSWDLARIEAAELPDGAVGLILSKLHGLPEDIRQLAELASCIGDTFEVQLLAELAQAPIDALEPGLERLTSSGLLCSAPEGLRFVHDRVREAAQQLLGDTARMRLHHRLGLLLLDQLDVEVRKARALEIADHLRRGRAGIAAAERLRVMRVLVEAGELALAAGAPSSALPYFQEAQTHFVASDWERESQLAYALWWGGANAAFQAEEHGIASEWMLELDRHPWPPLLKAQVTGLRILCEWYRSMRSPEYVGRVLSAFEAYGVRWPREPSRRQLRFAIWRTDRMLRGNLLDERFMPGRSKEFGWAAPLWLLSLVAPIFLANDLELMVLGTAYCMRQYLRHGTVHGPALALVSYAAYRALVLGDLSQLERFAAAGETWLARIDHGAAASRARMTLRVFVLPWIRPLRDQLEPLEALAEAFLESGDVEQAHISTAHRATLAMMCGEPLSEAIQLFRAGYRDTSFSSFAKFSADALELLSEPTSGEPLEARVDALHREALALVAARDYWVPLMSWLLVLSVMRRFGPAVDLAERMAAYVEVQLAPGPFIAEFYFWHAFVVAAAQAPASRSLAPVLRLLRRTRRRLVRWARHDPNLGARILLLEAELLWLRQRSEPAARRYAEVVACATREGCPWIAALALEQHHQLLQAAGDPRAAYVREDAIARYFAWGAMAKRDALRRRDPR